MGRLYLVADAGEITRRRKLVPPGTLVEAWQDLYAAGQYWLGETSKALLDGAGAPLAVDLSVEAERVPIYYGPRLEDVDSLPIEDSLLSRVLSAHGIAVAWITIDALGQRTQHEPQSPRDPIFYLRRPAGSSAHVWRLFRTRPEAQTYMAEFRGRDAEAAAWAHAIPAASFEELIERYATRG